MFHAETRLNSHFHKEPQKLILNGHTVVSAVDQYRDSHYTFGKHIHKDIEVYHITSGNCCMDIQNNTITCQKDDFIILLPNVVHSFFTLNESCTFRHIHFDPTFYASLYLDLSLQAGADDAVNLIDSLSFFCTSCYHVPISEKAREIMSSIILETNKDTPFSSANANLYTVQLLLYVIETVRKDFHSFEQKYKKQNNYVAFALSYIHRHYESKILIQDIAEKLNISSRYLSDLFFKKMNLTVLHYINIYRINKAIELMGTTDLSLTIIASQIGLKDSQHFSKLFRTIIGITPFKYRQMMRSSSEQ